MLVTVFHYRFFGVSIMSSFVFGFFAVPNADKFLMHLCRLGTRVSWHTELWSTVI